MRITRFLITAASVVFMTLALAAPAQAQDITPNSPCGELATGRRPDNGIVVGPYKAEGLYVNASGVWDRCPMPGRVVEGPRGCPGAPNDIWEVDGSTCNSTQSNQGPARPALPDGGSWIANAANGRTRGAIAYRCTDGKLTVLGSTCAPAATCPARQSIRYGTDEACTASVDVQGPSPVLGTVYAIPATAKPGYTGSVIIQCAFGGWTFVEAPRCVKTTP